MNKYYKILEFDKIIDLVKSYTELKSSLEVLDGFEDTLLIHDIDDVRYKLEETNEALIILNRMGKFQIYTQADVGHLLSVIHKNGRISPIELAQIGSFLDTLRDLFVYINKLDDNKIECSYLKNHLNNMIYPKDLNLKIRSIVTPYGEIKDDASLTLKELRRQYKEAEKSLGSKLNEVLNRNLTKLSSNVISIRNDRYVLPVKVEFKNQIKGIIHDESSSGETVYIEPLVICELNNKMASIKEQEKREIDNILYNIAIQIDLLFNELSLSYDELVYLDILFSKANYAKSINAFMPKVNNDGIVELYNCYHPLLNVPKIIKNNIILGKDYKGIIITGPNTGGKTVILKTLGLLSIMVKYGMLIPCDESSNIMLFDNVYADIGDEQSINQNLSTFSSHMMNVINIIDNVTSNSLVLLDELGSGTDPVEGSSLAISIFDYLINKDCLIVSTSHYSELKLHAYNSDNMINASVEFDVNTLRPTYRLLIGVPGMSNALAISKNLGLRSDILAQANDYVYKKNDNIGKVLDKMVKQSNLLDKKIQEVELEKTILKDKISIQDKEIEKTINERNKIIEKANIEKDKIIAKTKEELEDLLDDLKSMKSKSIKDHEIADIKHRIRSLDKEELEKESIDNNIPLTVGANVFIKSYNAYGIVTKLKDNKAEVNIGAVTIKVDTDDLKVNNKVIDNKEDIKKQYRNVSPTKLAKSVSPKLDLRGMRYEESKDAINKYIDDCMYAGLKIVTIIHGFGTGVIRKLVQDELKNNSNVKEFRYGGETEGGFGATVVTLKD